MRSPVGSGALAVVLLLGGAACWAAPAAESERGSWRRGAPWDDGKAEYCAYEAVWARYGTTYPGRALLVLVKEPWAPDLDVKADSPRPDGYDVLKLNHVRDVPTGVYTYHQMASVYFRRQDATLEKVAAMSSEACGVSTSQVRDGRLEAHSYFDGVGDRNLPWPAAALPEDGLPALLRDFVASPDVPAEVLVFPTLMDSRLADLEPWRARLTRSAATELEVPAGRYRAIELRLTGDDRERVLHFAADPPHELLSLATSEGTRYRLAKCERLAYWNQHAPGDEEWWPERLR